MKTTIMNQREVKLNPGEPTKMEITDYVRIDNFQLDITSGPNMLNKAIRVIAYGEPGQTFDFSHIILTVSHHLPIDTEESLVSKRVRWPVKYITIEPLQKDNWPIFIGINSLNLP